MRITSTLFIFKSTSRVDRSERKTPISFPLKTHKTWLRPSSHITNLCFQKKIKALYSEGNKIKITLLFNWFFTYSKLKETPGYRKSHGL